MENIMADILYRGLVYEKARPIKRYKSEDLEEIKLHTAFLFMALNYIESSDPEHRRYLKSSMLKLLDRNEFLFQLYGNIKSCKFNEAPIKRHSKAMLMLKIVFNEINLCLCENKPNAKQLNMLFRAAHNLPRCMISGAMAASEDDCIEYSLSNMDDCMKNSVVKLLHLRG